MTARPAGGDGGAGHEAVSDDTGDTGDALKVVKVVAAVIERDGRIFVTQRGYGEFKDQWEFPGGKIEVGETPEQALVREIHEELGATIAVHDHICTVTHNYAAFSITLHAYVCSLASEELTVREHVAADWLCVQDLNSKDWAEADKIIVKTISNILLPVAARIK